MKLIVVVLAIYICGGFLGCLITAWIAHRKKKSVFIPLDPSPFQFIPLLAMWPIFLAIAWIDMNAIDHASAETDALGRIDSVIGRRGITMTSLKPIGKIMIDGKLVEGCSNAGVIGKSTEVVIVSRRINQYVVKVCEPVDEQRKE